MLVTVTNTSGAAINVAAVGEDGVALGGGVRPDEATHRTNPLPFPFGWVGELADSGTAIFPMRPTDWYRQHPSEDQHPSVEWSNLVQAGTVTMTNAAETELRDPQELFLGDLA